MTTPNLEEPMENDEQTPTALNTTSERLGTSERQSQQLREEARQEFFAVRDGYERLIAEMRVLHEEVVQHLTRLGESGAFPRRRS